MGKGIDYAWHGAIDWGCLKSNGVTFIARYFSWDPSKDLTASELSQANSHGLAVVVVWETTANRMLGGYNAGVADAQETDKRLKSLGMGGCPAYFACDWDASEGEQGVINAYLDGAASIIGRGRVGMYAGYYPTKRAFDAGKMTYGWQTYAWSGGNWDSRAQLRQTQNGVTVCGLSCDWDESVKSDYAQWPRPTGASQPGTSTEVIDMTPAVKLYKGKLYQAMIYDDHKVNVKGPGDKYWHAVDNDSYAIGGISTDVDDERWVVAYINKNHEVCTYQKQHDSDEWGWANQGGKAA